MVEVNGLKYGIEKTDNAEYEESPTTRSSCMQKVYHGCHNKKKSLSNLEHDHIAV